MSLPRLRAVHSRYCNCNWGTCIAPPTRRPRTHHRVNPYLGARGQNETEMFSDHDETSPSIAAVSAPSVACSMLAVQQHISSVANSSTCPRHDEVATCPRGVHLQLTPISPPNFFLVLGVHPLATPVLLHQQQSHFELFEHDARCKRGVNQSNNQSINQSINHWFIKQLTNRKRWVPYTQYKAQDDDWKLTYDRLVRAIGRPRM